MGVKGVCIITMEIGPHHVIKVYEEKEIVGQGPVHHVIKVYEETDILSQEQGQKPPLMARRNHHITIAEQLRIVTMQNPLRGLIHWLINPSVTQQVQ